MYWYKMQISGKLLKKHLVVLASMVLIHSLNGLSAMEGIQQS
jgi:hypothetical protein